jgi:hypothetical protein
MVGSSSDVSKILIEARAARETLEVYRRTAEEMAEELEGYRDMVWDYRNFVLNWITEINTAIHLMKDEDGKRVLEDLLLSIKKTKEEMERAYV